MEQKNIAMGADALGGIQSAFFVDTFIHGLDAKKRLTIPSDWRTLVGSPDRVFVLPSSIDRCLCVYPARELNRRFIKLQELSETDAEAQAHLRELSANANMLPWDAQGRIRIKDALLEYAGLQTEVVMVGVFSRFELWSPEAWKQKQPEINQDRILAATKKAGL